MIIFGSILTTFESSIIFGGSWESNKNSLEPKTEPPWEFKLPKSVKHSVVQLSLDYFTTLSHFYLLLLLRWQPWCRSWCTACISSTRAVGWERSWRFRSCRSRPSPCPRSCRRDSSRPSLSNRLTRKRSSRCFKTLQDWITDYRISHLQLPGVNFINILRSPFSYKIALRSFFSSYSLALYFGKLILAQKLLIKFWWN